MQPVSFSIATPIRLRGAPFPHRMASPVEPSFTAQSESLNNSGKPATRTLGVAHVVNSRCFFPEHFFDAYQNARLAIIRPFFNRTRACGAQPSKGSRAHSVRPRTGTMRRSDPETGRRETKARQSSSNLATLSRLARRRCWSESGLGVLDRQRRPADDGARGRHPPTVSVEFLSFHNDACAIQQKLRPSARVRGKDRPIIFQLKV